MNTINNDSRIFSEITLLCRINRNHNVNEAKLTGVSTEKNPIETANKITPLLNYSATHPDKITE